MYDPNLEIGIVCGRCDTCSPVGAIVCPACGHELQLFPKAQRQEGLSADNPSFDETRPLDSLQAKRIDRRSENANAQAEPPNTPSQVSEENPMDQVKHYVCTSCMTPVPRGHKFCGRCGAPIPEDIINLRVKFFSDMQNPEKARLLLIRGDDMDGLSYHLKAEQHFVGRQGQIEFPEDVFVSPRHANLFYRDGKLVVRDEGSLNGIYFRVRGTVEVVPGDTFLVGEQLFRLDPAPNSADTPDPDGTFVYSSPKFPSLFRLNQILEGGSLGMTVCARARSLQIGREDGDLNFPGDAYMSAKHATIELRDTKFFLTDHDSRNGTYIRIKSEQALGHGDYVFIGRKLLRVELNAN